MIEESELAEQLDASRRTRKSSHTRAAREPRKTPKRREEEGTRFRGKCSPRGSRHDGTDVTERNHNHPSGRVPDDSKDRPKGSTRIRLGDCAVHVEAAIFPAGKP